MSAVTYALWAAVAIASVGVAGIALACRDKQVRERLERLGEALDVQRVSSRTSLDLALLVFGALLLAILRSPGLFAWWLIDEWKHHRDDWWPRGRK